MSRLQSLAAAVAPPILFAFIAAQIAWTFAPTPALDWSRSLLAGASILMGLTVQQRALRLFCLSFLATALAVAWWTGFSAEMLLGAARMAPLGVLIIMTPMAGFLFQRRPYGENLLALTRRWLRTSLHFHGAVMGLAHLLNAVTGMASLAIGHALLAASARDAADQRILSVSLLRGYMSAMFWAPASATVAIALDMLGVSFSVLLPLGLALALVYTAVSLVLEYPALAHRPALPIETATADSALLREFALATAAFMSGLLALVEWTGKGYLATLPLASVAFTALAFTLLRDWDWLWQRLRTYWRVELYQKSGDATALLVAGFLLSTLEAAGWGRGLDQGLIWLQGGPAGLLLLVLPLLLISLGAAGVPAMVGAALILGVLQNQPLPVAPVLVAGAVILGVVTLSLVGPVIAPVLLLSSLSGHPVTVTGARWNLRFAFWMFVAAQVLLQVLSWVGGSG